MKDDSQWKVIFYVIFSTEYKSDVQIFLIHQEINFEINETNGIKKWWLIIFKYIQITAAGIAIASE